MSATLSTPSPTVINYMEAGTTEFTPDQATQIPSAELAAQETKFVSPQEYRDMQEQRKHFMRLMKKRQERWNQPFSNAKIEDIQFILEKVNEVAQSYHQATYQNDVTRKALFAKGLLTQVDIDAVIERDNVRFEKANELREDKEMSVEVKKAIAQEFDIPLSVVGIVEETPEGDV